MAYGVELITDVGALAITEQYKNPILAASGNQTTVASTFTNGNHPSMAVITYTAANTDEVPILAIRPTAGTGLWGFTNTGTSWTFYLLSNQAIGTSIPYWIYSDQKAPTADDYGLHVYDTNGSSLVYSSADKHLRVIAVETKSIASGTTTDFTYTAGRTYAAVLFRWTEATQYFSMINTTNRFIGEVLGITDGIRAGRGSLDSVSGDATISGWDTMTIPIIDVTDQ